MLQVLEIKGLGRESLAKMKDAAQKSMRQPGVAVEIPKSVVSQMEGALDAVLSQELASLRERERSVSPEALKVRMR